MPLVCCYQTMFEQPNLCAALCVGFYLESDLSLTISIPSILRKCPSIQHKFLLFRFFLLCSSFDLSLFFRCCVYVLFSAAPFVRNLIVDSFAAQLTVNVPFGKWMVVHAIRNERWTFILTNGLLAGKKQNGNFHWNYVSK